MLRRTVFSGFGGQGLMFIGKLFAGMALEKAEHVTFIPSYGAEVRGGTSNCQITLASSEIASPIVEEADAMILMNQPSVDRFLPLLSENGTAFVNTSMAELPSDDRIVGIPATDLAHEAGNVLAANIVMFGAYLRREGLFSFEEVAARIAEVSAGKGAEFGAVNAAAFEKGWNFEQAG